MSGEFYPQEYNSGEMGLTANRHEHLYEKIEEKVIRSSDVPRDAVLTARMLLGSKVILCTLSMLSNPMLGVITRQVPVELVIVDEASQIEVGDYLPMLNRYNKTLRKIVFIGDHKQRTLPSYSITEYFIDDA